MNIKEKTILTQSALDGIYTSKGSSEHIGLGSILSEMADAISNGATAPTVVTIAANFTVPNSNYVIFTNVSVAPLTITLPAAVAGRTVQVKDSLGNSATNNITMARVGGAKIEGLAANKILQSSWGSWTFICNGTDWFMS